MMIVMNSLIVDLVRRTFLASVVATVRRSSFTTASSHTALASIRQNYRSVNGHIKSIHCTRYVYRVVYTDEANPIRCFYQYCNLAANELLRMQRFRVYFFLIRICTRETWYGNADGCSFICAFGMHSRAAVHTIMRTLNIRCVIRRVCVIWFPRTNGC